MTEPDQIRRWVRTWREAGPALEAVRQSGIRDLDPHAVLAALEGAFNHALRGQPPRASSGLVEMQAVFAKLRGVVR